MAVFVPEHDEHATGMWNGKPSQDDMHLLGGAFHIFHVYQCFGNASTWPHAKASIDTNLASQDNSSGVWGGKHSWADRGSWTTISSCIDLDGGYSLSRGSLGARKYRWAEVQAACAKYLRTAEYILNNSTMILDAKLYGGDTHLLHGPMYAVAECQQHFPATVKTRRPWKRWTNSASCIYA